MEGKLTKTEKKTKNNRSTTPLKEAAIDKRQQSTKTLKRISKQRQRQV